MPDLIGTQYSLLEFREEHISDQYIRWLNDPVVNRFLEIRLSLQTQETALKYVRSFYDGGDKKYLWRIHCNQSKQAAGTISLFNINKHHLWAYFGLMIGEQEYWGKG